MSSTREYFQRRIAKLMIEGRNDRALADAKLGQAKKAQSLLQSARINKLVQEGIQLLDEADEAGAPPPMSPLPAAPPMPAVGGMDMAPPPSEGAVSPDMGGPPQPTAEITLEKVIAKLNTIRGGKSLRDPMIYNKLNTYYTSLESEKKQELFDFLNSIAQVITDIVDSAQPPAPPQMDMGAPPPALDMGVPPAPAPMASAPPPAPSQMPIQPT